MKTQKRNIQFLERKEVEALIAGITAEGYRGLRDRALLEVLFSTGLRISEALALPKTVIEGRDMRQVLEYTLIGKGGWQRVVFFSPTTLKAIGEFLQVGGKYLKDDRLFKMTPRCAQQMVKRRASQVGLVKRITPHMFRHSLATDLLRQGVDVRVVQEFLGHRSISSTQVYTHVTNGQLKDIHKKLYK